MWLCHVASWLCRRVLFWFSWIGRVWLMGDKQWLLFYNWKKLCACQLVIGSSFPLFCFISSAWLLLLCLDLLGSVCCPVGGYGALCLCFDKFSLSPLLLLCLGLLRLLCVLLVFFKNLNVVFMIG
nr:uncharacterized protein LOC118036108 [Populus alba]